MKNNASAFQIDIMHNDDFPQNELEKLVKEFCRNNGCKLLEFSFCADMTWKLEDGGCDDYVINELAYEIDAFGKEYDHYGYRDAIDDMDKYWEQLTTDINNGDVRYLLDWLQEIINEDYEYSAKAKSLMDKLLDCGKD